jgi:hypothetical protein
MAVVLVMAANLPNFGHFLSRTPKIYGLLATTPPPEVYLDNEKLFFFRVKIPTFVKQVLSLHPHQNIFQK